MVINVYKESGMTSRDVVNLLIKHFHTKKTVIRFSDYRLKY